MMKKTFVSADGKTFVSGRLSQERIDRLVADGLTEISDHPPAGPAEYVDGAWVSVPPPAMPNVQDVIEEIAAFRGETAETVMERIRQRKRARP